MGSATADVERFKRTFGSQHHWDTTTTSCAQIELLMSHLSFHPGFHGGLLLAIAAAAAVLVWIFYRSAFRSLNLSAWLGLYGLRLAAILVVLVLLFRPIISFQRKLDDRPSLVFLLDNSASMSIADNVNGGTRFDRARNRLLEWESKLQDDFQLQLISFSDSTLRVKDFRRQSDLVPNGQATSLSRALREARQVARSGGAEAVFLLSDGIHNSAGDPIRVAGQMGLRVHTIGLGNVLRDRHSFRDVRVVSLECPDQLAVGNRARLSASVDAVGLPGRVMKLVFEEDGEEIAEEEVVLDEVVGLQTITAEFVPAKKGLHTYLARIAAAPEEKITQNNHQVASALVIDARIRVLYIEGTLRAEYGALVGRFLAKDPNVEYCALVQTRPNVFTQRTNIEGLRLRSIPDDAKFLDSVDVFLIGDLDSSYFRSKQMQLIQERVKSGAGLLMMGGYHSLGPGGYQGSTIEAILPVFVGDRKIGQIGEPFQMTLTPGRSPASDLRQHWRLLSDQEAGSARRRAAAAVGVCSCHSRQTGGHRSGNTSHRVGCWELSHAGDGRAACRRWQDGSLQRRHDAQLASNTADHGPRIAVSEVLGADRTVAGRTARRRSDRSGYFGDD